MANAIIIERLEKGASEHRRYLCSLVTGGASGLGQATVHELIRRGAGVTIVDLPSSNGAHLAEQLGARAEFVPADIIEPDQVAAALDTAESLRVLVHCAGRGGALRLVDRDDNPGSLELFEQVIEVNLIDTFNVLRLAATRMAASEPADGAGRVC